MKEYVKKDKQKKKDIVTIINLEIVFYLLLDRYIESFFIKKDIEYEKKSLKRNKVLFVKRFIKFKEF